MNSTLPTVYNLHTTGPHRPDRGQARGHHGQCGKPRQGVHRGQQHQITGPKATPRGGGPAFRVARAPLQPTLTLGGYNLAGCCSDSGGMRMSSKNPRETGRKWQHGTRAHSGQFNIEGSGYSRGKPLTTCCPGGRCHHGNLGLTPPSESHMGLCLRHSHTLSSHPKPEVDTTHSMD